MVLLPVHILGGMLALVFGYAALYAAKGAALHRKSGSAFVLAMIVMSLTGAIIATFKPDRGSMLAGSLTFYFVVTGMLAVKRLPRARQIEMVGMVAAFILGGTGIWAGMWLAQRGRMEAAPMFLFAILSIVAAIGDARMLRAGELSGKPRIKRHLWRLCFAMWVAAASFFWGPKGRVPEIIYYPALLPIPVLAPIAVMFLWFWRLRGRRPVRDVTIAAIRPMDQAVEVTS